jgi:single-strand DNA-binding protein
MYLPRVEGEFRVVTDPELRFSPSGVAVAKARIVANTRKKDEATGEWADDKFCWLNLTAFKKMAENFVESAEKGSLITVSGRIETRDYETREGEKRTSFDLIADNIGVSLTWDAAKVQKAERAAASTTGTAPAEDPWAAQPQGDEPPF